MRLFRRGRLGDLFCRERPRVFLGTISVAPRAGVNRLLEDASWWGTKRVPQVIHAELAELFAFPSVTTCDDPREGDLVLDILVPDYQLGGDFFASTGWGSLFLVWRPKVTVAARLVQIETDKTLLTFKAMEALGWKEYAGRFFRDYFRASPSEDNVRVLLYRASVKLLQEVRKHLE